ncbi:MAG TPA: LapA family protein [Candidatus Paceibacterota bacterium]
MIILFISGLLLGGVAVLFALQNIEIVTVNFLSWDITGSLALILGIAIALGAVAVALLTLPESISNYFKYRSLKKENEALAEELRKQKELTAFAKTTPPTTEAIEKIEQGAIAQI